MKYELKEKEEVIEELEKEIERLNFQLFNKTEELKDLYIQLNQERDKRVAITNAKD